MLNLGEVLQKPSGGINPLTLNVLSARGVPYKASLESHEEEKSASKKIKKCQRCCLVRKLK